MHNRINMIQYKELVDLTAKSLKRRQNIKNHDRPSTISSNSANLESNHDFVDHRDLDESNVFEKTLDKNVIENVIENVTQNIELTYESESSDESSIDNNSEDLLSFLRKWHVKHQCTSTSTNELLKYLNKNGYPFLPCDSRTLVHTPTSQNIINIDSGHYVHFGLTQGLNNVLKEVKDENLPNNLELDFNVDGVPLYKSAKKSFWNILGRVFNVDKNFVFAIGIYMGKTKPKCFNEFLKPLVDDIKSTSINYVFKGKHLILIVRCFICDAPAKADITGD